MTIRRSKIWLLTLTFSIIFIGCTKKSVPPNITEHDTLASIQKVDDYPLYTMTYYGDYGFKEYLLTGNLPFFSSDVLQREERFACTCFAAMGTKGSLIFSRNFDWQPNRATYLLLVTDPPDGFASISMIDLGFLGYDDNAQPNSSNNRTPLLNTPLFPFDGMNECGVAISMNAIPGAQSSYDPAKVTIGELQVLRLVLDYASNTEEAISLIQKYNVRIEDPPIHYLIADSSGHSTIIEFVDGNMIVMRNIEPWQVTTNFIISNSNAPENVSCWRYNTAYQTLKDNNGELSQNTAMNLLHQVSLPGTRWSAVYDAKTMEVTVVMGRKYEEAHKFTIAKNNQ